FLTATDPTSTLANAKTALLTVVARSCNTGFTLFGPDQKIQDNGKSPILMEPVKASVMLTGRPIRAVNILDQDGKRTGRTISVAKDGFAIDGAQDKTLYYELVFE